MKSETVNVQIYEVGDVVYVKGEDLRTIAKRRVYGKSTRAIIFTVIRRADGMYSYTAIGQNGKLLSLPPEELGNAKYVGHIDLDMLLDTKEIT